MNDTYGPYVTVEEKDAQHRMCIIRCAYPFDSSVMFRIYLFLSRNYPIISQLFVRFKLLACNHHSNNDSEQLKLFRKRIQTILDETSNKCFYYGQLCLHPCLLRLKHFLDSHYRHERLSSMTITSKSHRKHHEESICSFDLDTPSLINSNMPKKNSNRILDQSTSSIIHKSDSELLNGSSVRANPRTCGARFTSGTYLICFGRTSNLQQQQSQPPTSAPPILNSVVDIFINRGPPVHMRSMSLTVAKSRGNSSTDEQSSRYYLSSNFISRLS